MSNDSASLSSARVFRIDKFVVPADVRTAFIAQMQRIQETRRTLPGCLSTQVLNQTGGTGEFNVLTIVEWANEEAVASASAFMKRKFAEEGFDPVVFTKKAGVRSDQGFYALA